MSTEYRTPPCRAEEILKLIARTPSGRTLLEAFLPHLTRGSVKVVPYPAELVARLRAVIPEGQPIGACFEADPASGLGRIFLDFGSPIGVLAPFLVHEMAHALDPRAWRKAASRKITFEREAIAFQAQFRFTEELRARDAEYDQFLRERYPSTKMLHELLEPADIEALYGSDDDQAA